MSTTALIAEILVIGFFASIWILLLLLRISIVELPSGEFLAMAANWATPLLVIGLAVYYQLGILINGLCWVLEIFTIRKIIRNKIFSQATLDYNEVRTTVHHHASGYLQNEIMFDRAILRLTRAGALNFFIVAILMFTWGGHSALGGLLVITLSFWCLLLYVFRYKSRYKRMIAAYRVLSAA